MGQLKVGKPYKYNDDAIMSTNVNRSESQINLLLWIWYENIFNLPNNESNPHASHIPKLIPTEPVLTSKPDGDTNIPDPIQRTEYDVVNIYVQIQTKQTENNC